MYQLGKENLLLKATAKVVDGNDIFCRKVVYIQHIYTNKNSIHHSKTNSLLTMLINQNLKHNMFNQFSRLSHSCNCIYVLTY